jgi:hypothetical protein
MAVAVDRAVSAARVGDAEAFADARAELERLDRGQLAALLGDVTRDLIERAHPDGLDSDDAAQILESATRAAAPWYPAFDADALVRALAGTLGVDDPDAPSPLTRPTVLAHGLLLVADLLAGPPDTLPEVLDLALRELMRAQTVELP